MKSNIDCNYNYSTSINKTFINNLLIYSDDDFIKLCNDILLHKLNIQIITLCNHTLLYHQLDNFIHNLMFIYQFHRVYTTTDENNKTILFNLINYMRETNSYLNMTHNCFLESYYNKIPEYILNIIKSIDMVYKCDELITISAMNNVSTLPY